MPPPVLGKFTIGERGNSTGPRTEFCYISSRRGAEREGSTTRDQTESVVGVGERGIYDARKPDADI